MTAAPEQQTESDEAKSEDIPSVDVSGDDAQSDDAQSDDARSDRLLDLITSSLDQDGAEEILDIPLAGKSTVADHMVIASGRSTRHVAALSEKLVERLKAEAGTRSRVEGREAADWVLIDAGDVVVHIFRPEVRAFYQLEKMWLATPDRAARPA
ncbi:MAG TPA: ribosome silencing factor [Thermohalobaculum sp.]|nr:ribosome silencing factor [Thermohalobaculum sp.]